MYTSISLYRMVYSTKITFQTYVMAWYQPNDFLHRYPSPLTYIFLPSQNQQPFDKITKYNKKGKQTFLYARDT